MGTEQAEATFPINLETNAAEVGAEAAAALEQFRRRIQDGSDAVRQMSASMRSLRGSSDEVKAAKKQLGTLIEAEKNSISAANLALLKQGITYEKLAGHAKNLATEKAKLDARMK